MRSIRFFTIMMLVSASLMIFVSETHARNTVGVRLGSYTDLEDLFIGGEILAPVGMHTWLNPNIEYVFIDYGTYLTVNLDAHYDFQTQAPVFFWLGGGLGLAYFSPEDDDIDSSSDLALNLLGGLGLKTQGNLIPYVQVKAILGDAEDFVLSVGLRF